VRPELIRGVVAWRSGGKRPDARHGPSFAGWLEQLPLVHPHATTQRRPEWDDPRVESLWPTVAPIAGERLIAEIYQRAGLRLRPVRMLDGGQVGALLVQLPDGSPAVLSSWDHDTYARLPIIEAVVCRLRETGYPAPAYRRVIDCGDVVAVVQEFVDADPVGRVTAGLVETLVDLNARQRKVFDAPGGSLTDLHLNRDGPGFCLHASLEEYSAQTRALLAWVRDVGRTAPADVFTGADAVHLDFHPGNVLLARGSGSRVAAVIDWTGATVGDCGLDLVTLGFACDHLPGEPGVAELIRAHILATVSPPRIAAFTAHMALRMVDWAIRHFNAQQTAGWVTIATEWKSFATSA
jgi:Phosphotransferase enzyme family